ncbi:MAG: PilC/PilY family type IV pilus protein [Lautropia sp.]|nr:PilC/PilY family type IV pilus protein [Lautropia sp.]
MAQTTPASTIAQEPLVVKDPGVVEPNLMFTLDDSASMAYNFLPDDELPDHTFAFHPAEPWGEWVKYYVHYTEGLLATNDSNVLGMRRRAPKVNKLYYNPEVQYLPWVDENGRPMANANPKGAYFHLNYSGRGDPNSAYNQRGNRHIRELKMDLTGEVSKGSMRVCQTPRPGKLTSQVVYCDEDRSVTTVKPATYYEFTWDGMNEVPPREPTEADKGRAGNYKRVSIADHAEFIRGAERKDCSSDGTGKRRCTREQEYQNFANWYQYHRTRMHVAIASVGQAFAALPDNMRLGYGRINKLEAETIDGGRHEVIVQGVRRFQGDERRKFLRWLNGNIGVGSTPLVNAVDEVGKYFRRADHRGPWGDTPGTDPGPSKPRSSHLSCRRSYHLLMTDGMYNFDDGVGQYAHNYTLESDSYKGNTISGPDGASYTYEPILPYASSARGSLADYAMDLWKNDLRADLVNDVQTDNINPAFWQHVSTYTLSFGVSGALNPDRDEDAMRDGTKRWPNPINAGTSDTIDDLWHAAVNSRGQYVNVQEGAGFFSRIQQILSSIQKGIGNAAGVAVSSQSLQANNVKYVPSYVTRDWTGEVEAFRLDMGVQKESLWKATEKVPPALSRNWFVGLGVDPGNPGTGDKSVMFFWDRIPADMRTQMMKSAGLETTPNRGSPMMAWLRGDQSNEGSYFRRRSGVLGHIVNSPPVYVGADIDQGYRFLPLKFPNGVDSGASSYRAHVNAKKASAARPGLVFVGSNDGVLHAFDAATGVEVYGFTPHAVTSEMARSSRVTYEPRYLMDGPLVERDAFWDRSWRRVLLGSTGAGPRSVFALDVLETAPGKLNAKTLMWELDARTQPEIGHVLAAPEVGVLRDGRWVAVFGNGYESASRRAQLFVVELKTGKVLRTIDTGVGDATTRNGLGGVTLVKDGTQVITAAYAGDLRGNVWKFDLASEDETRWKVGLGGKALFTTVGSRPVTAAPATVVRPDAGVMVLVGTGKLFQVDDDKSVELESVYGLWDNERLVGDKDGKLSWTGGSSIRPSQVRTNDVTMLPGNEFARITTDKGVLNWDQERGWRVPLTMLPDAAAAQRMIVKPQFLTGLALFETMSPALSHNYHDNACKTELHAPAFSLLLDPLTGLMASKATIDTNGDNVLNADDKVVGGWSVQDWAGRSVVLTAAPPAPCTSAPCTQAATQTFCERGSLLNTAVAAKHSQSACVPVPPDSRWWWREMNALERTP